MHEWGIAQDLVDEVKRQATKNGITEVTKVGVSLGKLSHLTPLSLKTCFKALTKEDEMLKRARLQFKKTLDHAVIIDIIQGKT
ncbi:MAG: hydrogenase maturation nickel metallochaperone HypA [Planctomycetota bacterium]